MRGAWLALLSVLGLAVMGLTAAPASAATEHSGQRLAFGTAAFADAAACADGSCDALYLTGATGVLGAASEQVPLPGIVLVQVMPSTVEDGMIFPAGPPSLVGCSYDASVGMGTNLRAGTVETAGRVELRDFVEYEDGSFDCTTPNGHWLDAQVQFTGVGLIDATADSGHYATAWTHEFGMEEAAYRAATADAVIALDDTPVSWPQWPDSGLLASVTARGHTVLHQRAVGPSPRLPLVVPAHATLVQVGSGSAGDWTVDVVTMQQGEAGKTYLGLSGMLNGEFVYGDSVPTTVTIADDLSAAVVVGTVTLFRDVPGGSEPVADATVQANWAGTGQPWWWTSKGAVHGPDGNGHFNQTGVHRDAILTLQVDGTPTDGTGYLETFTVNGSRAG